MSHDRQSLGSRIYVEIDDGMIKLTMEHEDEPRQPIWLDVEQMDALDVWWTRVQEKYKSRGTE
jgi:hypothetical protein